MSGTTVESTALSSSDATAERDGGVANRSMPVRWSSPKSGRKQTAEVAPTSPKSEGMCTFSSSGTHARSSTT